MAIRRFFSVLSLSFSLFSMFFGAGNLLFPLIVGVKFQENALFALLGLCLTACIFPLAAMLGLALYQGSLKRFFYPLPKGVRRVIEILLFSIIGPLLVIPRLFSLMGATISPEHSSQIILLIGILSFAIALRARVVLTILGKYLGPILLVLLLCMIAKGAQEIQWNASLQEHSWRNFSEGIVHGYQMMDLMAALVFGGALIPLWRKQNSTNAKARKNLFWAAPLAAFFLFLVYFLLGLITSATSSLASFPDHELFPKLCEHLFGFWGLYVAKAIIFLACFTTSISLLLSFCRFVQKDLAIDRPLAVLFLGCGVSVILAFIGLPGIIRISAILLQYLYPIVIALTGWSWFRYLAWNSIKSLCGVKKQKPVSSEVNEGLKLSKN